MHLYKISKQKVTSLKQSPFKLERDMQKLIEANLSLIMGLRFIASEFTIKNKRIDTLAFDPEAKSFVIIEYKRDRNASVVDQGFAYLSLMLDNKADFILEYNESTQSSIKKNDVDWSQTRVVFVSTGFTENQRVATNFSDLAIELWEVQKYEENLLFFNQIKKSSNASVRSVLNGKQHQQIMKEIQTYTEAYHLDHKPEATVELYKIFKEGILSLSEQIDIKPTKPYIAFKFANHSVCDITVLKRKLKLWINKKEGTLIDPLHLTRNVTNIGHWGNGDYELEVESDKDLEYILSLIKQALRSEGPSGNLKNK